MANEFHATVQPGTTITISDTMIIAFDKPSEADPVTITLTEVDAWISDGAKVEDFNQGSPELIAEFTGKIVGGKFTGTQTKPAPPLAAGPGAVTLKLRFDGEPAGTVHQVTLPAAAVANEAGIFEVQLKVTGTVNKKPGSYTAPGPVFVRRFKSGRPVISFITGSDAAGYFAAAKQFMEQYADATISRDNVLDIREFLRTQSAARGFGPWGEVNIVDHGNAVEWIIKLLAADSKARHLRRWDIEDAASQAAFQRPISTVLDKDSTLVIRGCAIGNDQALLDQIRVLFGGVCRVLAPKHLQEYEAKSGVVREGFFEVFHVLSTAGPAKGAATVPSDAECVKLLKAAFPSPVPPISDAEWLKFLGRRALDRDGFRASDASGSADRTETVTWRQALTINHAAGQHAQAVTTAQASDWRGNAEATFDAALPKENLDTRFADWHFVEGPMEEKPVKGGTKFSKLFTGTRVRIEIRRELRDAQGTPVKPDLTNPDHYGSSP